MLDFLLGGFLQKVGLAVATALLALSGFSGGGTVIETRDELPSSAFEDAFAADEIEPEPLPEKKAVTTPPPPSMPHDVCANIEDTQKTVPAGFVALGSVCYVEEDIDRCPNLEGIQNSVPSGMTYYKNTRECLTPGQIDRLEEDEAIGKKTTNSSVKEPEEEDTPSQTQTTSTDDEPFTDKDCADFATHAEAQAFFEAAGGPAKDPHKLDGNNKNGLACESLP